MHSGRETISDARLMELAAAVIRAVASLHQLPGLLTHGAITPAHVVITSQGNAMLTDAIFGSGIEALNWTREQLWRELRIGMPRSINTHCFDQRAVVTQLHAVVLAVALRRSIRADEYPDGRRFHL